MNETSFGCVPISRLVEFDATPSPVNGLISGSATSVIVYCVPVAPTLAIESPVLKVSVIGEITSIIASVDDAPCFEFTTFDALLTLFMVDAFVKSATEIAVASTISTLVGNVAVAVAKENDGADPLDAVIFVTLLITLGSFVFASDPVLNKAVAPLEVVPIERTSRINP